MNRSMGGSVLYLFLAATTSWFLISAGMIGYSVSSYLA
jgi:hypothetical protein